MARQVLIVGGGIIGLCTAYYALLKGLDVTLLERGGADHDGCSQGNAGMIVPSHFIPLAAPGMVGMGLKMLRRPDSPFAIRPRADKDLISWAWQFMRHSNAGHVERAAPLLRDISLASRREYETLADGFGNDFGLVKKGLLMLCKTPHALDEEARLIPVAHALGMPAERLTAEETAQLDPTIQMDIAGAVYFPQDCHLQPQKLVAGLTHVLEGGGAQFHWDTEVTGWRTKNGRIEAVQTTQGEFTADEYVLAGGSWSPGLVRGLKLALPLQAGKGYSVTLPNPRELPTICSLLTEARVAVTPMGDTLRFGGTMEIAGLDPTVQQARVNGILNAIPRYFPSFTPDDFRDLPVWSGLRPCSPDGLPYIGRFGRYQNLAAATGHCMMGISLGPITGKLMAELLNGETPEIDITALRPDRYG